MPRTLILTLASPKRNHYSSSEYWSVMEDGRICNGLCWDEMLGTVARLTLNESNTYSMQTLEEHTDAAEANGKRRSTPTRLEDALRQLVAAFQGKETAGPLQAAMQEAEAAIEQEDEARREADIPF